MKLYVVDGNSLLFRAYYATSFTGNIMRRKDGFPTNAIFGFSNMMTKLLSQLKDGDKLFVSFDTGKPTFRKQKLESYKAQRKPIEEDLTVQLPVARELLKAMGIFYYEEDGYEGDDIAGTVAKLGSSKNIETICFTSDKDYLQLIDDNITIHMLKKGLTDIEEMNEESLKEKMGLTPLQIIDFKGLMGDPSDNLKGIPGVGEKTAIKLIQQHGSLENIIEAMKTDKSKLAQKILENQELGYLCKEMATIVTDMKLPFTLDELDYEGYDYNELSNFYTKYECFSLLKKLKPNDKKATKNKKVEQANFDKITVRKFKEIPFTPVCILDIEKGNYNTSPINGICFAKDGITYYLPYFLAKNDADFISYMEDENIKKITFDYKALKVSLNRDNINVKGLEFDLSLASYLLDTSLSNDPVSIFGYHGINILFTSNEISLFEDNETVYNMAYHLEKIYPDVIKKLEDDNSLNLLKKIELPLCEVLAEMEIEGFPIHKEVLEEMNNTYKDILNKLQEQIYSLAGYSFNIASPKQIADLLFHKLNLPTNKKESTSIEVLNFLRNKHPIVPLLIEHRKYSKIISTYTEGLLSYVHEDNKLHTIFNQALTQTGRLSSSEPNLQNISTRNEEGKLVRKAFYYDNDYLLSLDYSQIELRILASMSSCSPLIETFNNDEDIHSRTAMDVFNVNKEFLTPELRRRAKAVNFGIIYGISDWGLSEQISSSAKEAKEIITTFYNKYPEVKNYFTQVIQDTKELGYSTTLYGRKRHIPEISSDNYNIREFGKRAAMNASIQGTGADIIKIAMIIISKFLKENNYKTKMVLQIHDELIFRVPEEEKDIMPSLLKDLMENCVSLKVKLKVEGSLAKTWYDCK